MYSLFIFSDASIYQDTKTGKFTGCSGVIAVQLNYLHPNCTFNPIINENYQILTDTTVNRSELHGIYLALEMQNRYRYIYNDIHIFSDSALSVKGLRDWFFSWNKGNKNYFTNSSFEYVKNQDMFKYVAYYILNNNLNVNLHHCKGHINISEPHSIKRAIDTYKTSNGCDIDKNTALTISFYNNMVDNKSREYLNCYLSNYVPISYTISYPEYDKGKLSTEDIRKYASLITK